MAAFYHSQGYKVEGRVYNSTASKQTKSYWIVNWLVIVCLFKTTVGCRASHTSRLALPIPTTCHIERVMPVIRWQKHRTLQHPIFGFALVRPWPTTNYGHLPILSVQSMSSTIILRTMTPCHTLCLDVGPTQSKYSRKHIPFDARMC
jgi:hypothetical protein